MGRTTLLTRLLMATGVIDRRFRAEAMAAFAFLHDDLGFREPQFQADAFGAAVTYRARSVAVSVSLDKMEYITEVYVIRLRDGEIPLLVEEPQNWIYLSSLVAMRAPAPASESNAWVDGSSERLRRDLLTAAHALRTYGSDALAGESVVFDEIAKRYPQPRRRRDDFAARNSAIP